MSALHDGRRTPVPAVSGTGDTIRGGWRGWVARRPVTAFLLIALPLGWAVLAVPALAYHGLLPGGQLPVEPFALALTVLVMLPAAVWVVSVAEGRAGVRRLFARTFRWRFGLGRWTAVLLAVPVGTVVLGLLLGRSLDTADLPSVLISGTLSALLPLFRVNLWEETMRAGFVQVHLERRHGLVAAAALTGVAFAAIHVPMSFTADVTASSGAGRRAPHGAHRAPRPGSRHHRAAGDRHAGRPARNRERVVTMPTTDARRPVPVPPGGLAPGRLALSIGGLLVLGVLVRLLVGATVRGATGSLPAAGLVPATFNAANNEGNPVDDLLAGGQPSPYAVVAAMLFTAGALLALRTRRRVGKA